jgi:MFS family permease
LEPNIVGYVAATFFLTNSISSFVWGKIIPRTGRRFLFFITIIFESVFLAITYLFATDNTSLEHASVGAYAAVFGTAVIFAIGDSVLESQVPAIIQSPSFFPDEKDRDAANSNVRLWQPLGFTFQFVLGIIAPGASNVWLQAVILMPLLVVSIAIVFILDRWVQPLEKTDKGYTAVRDSVEDHA